MNQLPTTNRIPQFEALEQESAFGDAHDTTTFEDEFELQPPVEIGSWHLKPLTKSTLKRTERQFAVQANPF